MRFTLALVLLLGSCTAPAFAQHYAPIGGGGGDAVTMTVTWAGAEVTAGQVLDVDIAFSDGEQRPVELVVYDSQGALPFLTATFLALQVGGEGTVTFPTVDARGRVWFLTNAAGVLNAAFTPDEFALGTYAVAVYSAVGQDLQLITVNAP